MILETLLGWFRGTLPLRRKTHTASNRSNPSRLTKLTVEQLEDRTVPSVLPAPVVGIQGTIDATGHSPQIAMNPLNPLEMVTVYVGDDPFDSSQILEGQYSTDGGLNWTKFLGRPTNNDFFIDVGEPEVFDDIGNFTDPMRGIYDPSVSFDRNGDFYISWAEKNPDDSRGVIAVSKFAFNEGDILADLNVDRRRLYQWDGQDPAYNPAVIADTNLPTFTDPETGETRTDELVNMVYVAWNIDNVDNNAADPIRVSASADGGLTFTTSRLFNDLQFKSTGSTDVHTSPQLAIGPSGELLATWAREDTPGIGQTIQFDAIANGGVGAFFTSGDLPGLTGSIADAQDPASGNNHIPVTTTFTLDVPQIPTGTGPFDFDTISDMDVILNLNHLDPDEIEIRLTAPNGVASFLLLNNRILANGNAVNAGVGAGAQFNGQNDYQNTNPPNTANANHEVGLVFDDEAGSSIRNGNNVFRAHFRPEGGDLEAFDGQVPSIANIVGTWTLEITDFRNSNGNEPTGNNRFNYRLLNWGLRFTSKLDDGFDSTATSGLAGIAPDFPFATDPASPVSGVGPSPVIAIDNSLGSYSPYRDRIYVAYVSPSNGNDIRLVSSDDGGFTWNPSVRVNNDTIEDSFTEGTRAQFTPQVAVDQITGTVVVTWYDTRFDAALERSANYIVTSIDGGLTFSEQVFLNAPKTANNALTGENIVIEPIPNNPNNTGNAQGFGDRQALVVHAGNVIPVWAGNLNANGSSILFNPTTIAAGPRIVEGDMGPITDSFVSGPIATIGPDPETVDVTVDVDRFVGPIRDLNVRVDITHTFDGDLTLSLISPTGTEVLLSAENGGVGDNYENTLFDDDIGVSITQGLAPFNGTFRPEELLAAFNGEDPNGTWTLRVVDDAFADGGTINSFSVIVNGIIYENKGQTYNDRFDSLTGQRIFDAFRVVFDRPIDPTTFTPDDVTLVYRTPTSSATQPGETLAIAQVEALNADVGFGPNGVGAAGELATEFLVHLETPTTRVGTYSYAIGPTIRDRIRSGPLFSIGPDPEIESASVEVRGLDDPITDVDVTIDVEHTAVGDLEIFLVSPTGTSVLLVNNRGGLGDDFDNTTFDDDAGTPITAGAPPYSGTFQPEGSLADFNGQLANGTWRLFINDTSVDDAGLLHGFSIRINGLVFDPTLGRFVDQNQNTITQEDPEDVFAVPNPVNGVPFQLPYDANTLPLIIPGPYIIDTLVVGQTTTQDNLTLNGTVNSIDVVFDRVIDGNTFTAEDVLSLATPIGLIESGFTVTANPAGTPPELRDRIFRIGFPTQELSGSYSVLLGPDIRSVEGSLVDSNFNAGLQVLRGEAANPGALATIGPSPQTVNTAIEVSGIIGPITDVDVRLDITHTAVGDLTVSLISPTGTEVILSQQNGGTGDDYDNTLFNDAAATAITSAVPPFTGTFRPQQTLGVLNGENPNGFWTLRIVDGNAGEGGTLDAVSLIVNGATFGLTSGTQIPTFGVTTPTTITPNATVTSALTITDNFVIDQNTIDHIRLQLDISHPTAPDLSARLIAPDGTSVQLFTPIAQPGKDFNNTIFDDFADTPIRAGSPPYQIGPFNPQLPLSVLDGKGSAGIWTLEITNGGSSVGALNTWSLELPRSVPKTGLGETVADRSTASFRIFTQDPTDDLTQTAWTDIGPEPLYSGEAAGRVTAIAVDPSATSGNVVYVGGGSGGLWKTTNFLTTDPKGPTWIPLFDLAPTISLRIGTIEIFGENNDSDQSILFVGTGEANIDSRGVGIMRSTDGGRTWEFLDSLSNGDGTGGVLPFNDPTRDRTFLGATSVYKIVVDPVRLPNGEIVVYAAIGSAPGGPRGLYRSIDSGLSWQLIRAGEATDVVLAPGSVGPNGNLQRLYASFEGEGVFTTSNAPDTASLSLMTGGIGNDTRVIGNFEIPVTNPPTTPNGNDGRIVLATPEFTGNPLQDTLYQEWLYAGVANSAGNLKALYVTKDAGDNWTQLQIPALSIIQFNDTGFGTNDESRTELNPLGGPLGGTGDYSISLAIDPLDPHIVYFGGTDGVIRVDTTTLSDPYAFIPFDNSDPDGGLPQGSTTGPTSSLGSLLDPGGVAGGAARGPQFDLLRDPDNPFFASGVLQFSGSTATAQFNNGGDDLRWRPFDTGAGIDLLYHAITPIIDPLTGDTRLLFGSDYGISSTVDRGDGLLHDNIGQAIVVNGSRNGQLHMLELNAGAIQPSTKASDLAQTLFYGLTDIYGAPSAGLDLLQTGNLTWTPDAGVGDNGGEWIVTAPGGSGETYRYIFPDQVEFPLSANDFFQLIPINGADPIGRTDGTLQPGDFSRWPRFAYPSEPFQPFGTEFEVNPHNNSALVLGDREGRVYRSTNKGVTWNVIGEPNQVANSQIQAFAFGAPSVPNPTGATSNFIWAGAFNGQIYVTQTGGAPWTNVSAGLDGSTVESIVAHPTRGNEEAYAITQTGVFHIDLNGDPTTAVWQNITGNLFDLTRPVFADAAFLQETLLDGSLTSLVVDFRFDNSSTGTPPILYVAGHGGVFRSIDEGATWTYFPDVAGDGAAEEGGYLPNINVVDLDLMIGDIDPNSGLPDQPTGLNLLVATTEGRGVYAIRLDNNIPVPNNISGPAVTNTQVTQPMGLSTVASIDITFDSAVDPGTLTAGDFVVLDPSGNPVSVVSIVDNTNTPAGQPNPRDQYRVNFETTTAGLYTLSLGPNVANFSGQSMNQDGDGINGENPDDIFTTMFQITVSQAPVISPIAELVTTVGMSTGPIAFTVSDLEDDDNTLMPTATSSNQTLVTDGNITILSQGGPDRTIEIVPEAGQSGATTITITVTDVSGRVTTRSFDVRVRQDAALQFLDNFDRPNSGVLGAEWTDQVGNFTLNGSIAQPVGPFSLATLDGISARNVSVESDVVVSAGGAHEAGLVARFSADGFGQDSYSAVITFNNGGYFAEIRRVLDGVTTVLASNPISGGFGRLRFEAFETSFKAFFNDQLVAFAHDVQAIGMGTVGIQGTSGGRLDNFDAFSIPPDNETLDFDDIFTQVDEQLDRSWLERLGNFLVEGDLLRDVGDGSMAIVNGIAQEDVLVSAEFDLDEAATALHGVGLVARYTGPVNESFYQAWVYRSNGQTFAALFKSINGNFTLLGGPVMLGSDNGLLEFEVAGSSLTLSHNGIVVLFASDNSITQAGSVGVRALNAGGSMATMDTFHAEALPTPSATLLFMDNFNGDTELDDVWRNRLGRITVVGDQAKSDIMNGGSMATLNTITNPSADIYVEANYDLNENTTSFHAVGLVARYTGPVNESFYQAWVYRSNGDTFAALYKNINGVSTLLAGPVSLGPVTSGSDSGLLRFEVVGNSLALLRNGTIVLFANDNSLTQAGSVGMRVFNSGGGAMGTLDNFEANAVPSPSATLEFNDNFNGDTELDDVWRNRLGRITVVGDRAKSDMMDGGSMATLNTITNPSADIFVEANFDLNEVTTSFHAVGLVARYTGPVNESFYQAWVYRSNGDTFAALYKNINGVFTLLGGPVALGSDNGLLRFEVVGSSLKLFHDGTFVMAANDTSLTQAGSVGMRMFNSGGAMGTLDNFRADALPSPTTALPFFDNFGATGNNAELDPEWRNQAGHVTIIDGEAGSDINGGSMATLNGVSSADVRITANFEIDQTSDKFHGVGVVARYSGPLDRNYYLAWIYNQGGQTFVSIFRNLNGNYTLLGRKTVANDSGMLQFDVVGSSLELSINGNLELATTDTSITNPGSVGIRFLNTDDIGGTLDLFNAIEL